MALPRPLLVLDLDGTLLDAAPAGRRPGRPSFVDRGKEVRLRPGLGEFLSCCIERFDVAVWTAAPLAYAEAMCAGITAACCPSFAGSLVATFAEAETEVLWRGSPTTIKELRNLSDRLARPLSRCLVVDDTPSTYSRNVANALPVPTYRGSSPREQREDSTLLELQRFLMTLSLDMEAIDVSGWKHAPPGATRKPLPDVQCSAAADAPGTLRRMPLPAAANGDFGEVAPEEEATPLDGRQQTAPECNDLESLRSRSEIAHICGHVYLSNYFAAKSLANVESLGITHILNCAAELPNALATQRPALIYSKLALADNPNSILDLDTALGAVDAAAAAGGRILVHCAAGGSRSAAVVCAWIARERVMGYDAALEFVRTKRWVQPNAGFERQLRAFSERLPVTEATGTRPQSVDVQEPSTHDWQHDEHRSTQ